MFFSLDLAQTNCTAGTYNEVKGQSQCRTCDKGTYSLEIGAYKNPCTQCPIGAVCSGGTNMETSVVLSIPQPGNTDGKNVFLSYWRDPEILNQTSKASTCFYQCVEPKACLGTLSCNDEESGTGVFCRENRVLIMNNAKSTNKSKDSAVPLGNYTIVKSEKTVCIETSSIGDQYCVAARLGEECARGYTGPACGEFFFFSSLLSFYFLMTTFSPLFSSFPTKKTQLGVLRGTPALVLLSALNAWPSVLQLQW